MDLEDYAQVSLEIAGSIIAGLLVAAIILVATGYDPWQGLYIMLTGGLGDPDYLLSRASFVLLTGLAFALPMLASAFNIGGEGQMYVGGIVALMTSLAIKNPWVAITAGALSGAALGFVTGALRAYREVNEVITAIMLNWIFYYLSIFLITSYLYNPQAPYRSVSVPEGAQLGFIEVAGTKMHLIFPLTLLISFIAYFLVFHTRIGYRIRVAGLSPDSARYSGINAKMTFTNSMALGGLFGGLSGALNVIAFTHYMDQLLTSMMGMGFDGIGVALMGRNHPIGIIFSAIFFSMLLLGGQKMQIAMNVPKELTDALSGVIIISLAMPYAYKMLMSYLRVRRMMKVARRGS